MSHCEFSSPPELATRVSFSRTIPDNPEEPSWHRSEQPGAHRTWNGAASSGAWPVRRARGRAWLACIREQNLSLVSVSEGWRARIRGGGARQRRGELLAGRLPARARPCRACLPERARDLDERWTREPLDRSRAHALMRNPRGHRSGGGPEAPEWPRYRRDPLRDDLTATSPDTAPTKSGKHGAAMRSKTAARRVRRLKTGE